LKLTDSLVLKGKGRFLMDEFTKMPRGQITMKIAQSSLFKRD
jgi:hypothetical protein